MTRILHGLSVLLAILVLAGRAAAASPARTEILWDRYGVAHVYAKDTPDLFRAYGWAQTKSHGDALLKLYAQARGRAAEYFGPSELRNDRWMAVNGVPERGQAWLEAQTPEFRGYLEAFADGINAYGKAHPEALSEASRRVLPVSAADVTAYAHRLFQFQYLAPMEVTDRLPADAVEKEPSGSNGWAIAPSRSENGRTMLLMNPHLGWATGWSTYYEIQLTAPGVDLYGASQIGLPVLRFVFSDDLGFTQTVNGVNGVTYYRIVPAVGGYRFDGAVRPYEVRRKSLKIRRPDGGFDSETVEVRSTVHGPVIAERDGAPVAMRVAGLDRPFGLEQYWRMATARDFAAYEAAVSRLQVPTFNIIYGDKSGRIQYLYNGLVPRRTMGDLTYWTSVVPGDRSDNLWTSYLSYAELPKVTDPAGGFVQNSNDPPWNAGFPLILDARSYAASIPAMRVNLRTASAIRMLAAKPKLSFDDLVRYKWSTRSELADRVLPDLLGAVALHGTQRAKQAAEVLSRWDRTTQANSRGALLFLDWADRKGAAAGYAGEGFLTPYRLEAPLTTPGGLRDPAGAAAALDAAAAEVLRVHGALDRPWGEVMRLRSGAIDLPGSGGPGRMGIFDVIDFGDPDAGAARSANFGSSYIALVSFDGPTRAKVLMSYGNASQPGSPHITDQLPLLSSQTLRDAWRTRAEVEANLEARDLF